LNQTPAEYKCGMLLLQADTEMWLHKYRSSNVYTRIRIALAQGSRNTELIIRPHRTETICETH
jgi:hypothetical protein